MSNKALLCKHYWSKRLRTGAAACLLSMFSLHPVWADDIEIYFNSANGANVKPNLLFILDASGSMDAYDCADSPAQYEICNDGTENGDNTRLERMVVAMENVLSSLSDDLNVGLMRFSGWHGGSIIYPVSDLAEPGVRAELSEQINDIVAGGGTPTVGAFEEAWRYYSGSAVNHGKLRSTGQYNRVSHPDSYAGGYVDGRGTNCDDDDLNHVDCENEHIDGSPVYTSPIAAECQANYVIFLTDGEPWVGWDDTPEYPDVYNATVAQGVALNGGACSGTDVHRLCGVEYAGAMAPPEADEADDDIPNVITHTIGFNIQDDWLSDVATAGKGDYFSAESSGDLVTAIAEIIQTVPEAGSTFVAPSVTIDQVSRLSHNDEVYLALFNPKATTKWIGNLKKFEFKGANPTLKDWDGVDAIDAATGEFVPESRSFWSATADGDSVESGGAASHLDMDSRNMYSNLAAGNADLTVGANEIKFSNVSNAMIGAADDAERTNFINWLAGVDVKDEDRDGATNDARKHIGDPLHSNPVVVAYEPDDTNDPNSLVFFGTNEGFLHAIDTEDGAEEYAFMPKELMPNVPILYEDMPLGRTGFQATPSPVQLSPVGATQSSTGYGGHAARAIDGNTSGDWGMSSITHTNLESQPWLDIDLGAVSDVTEVTVWNRTNCCSDRLSDFHVLISESPFTGTLSSNLTDPDITSYFHSGTLSGSSVSIPIVGTGQYVRIQLQGSNYLSLAEVSITGTAASASGAVRSKPYGMDGKLTLRTIDNDKNGLIDDSESDKAYLYAGMRRGGRNYYALDVSTRDEPEFKWSILGGQGDFAELGQTWSKLISTKIKVGTTEKDVLVFGGGYDPAQDSKETRSADTQGRAIYIVDADTGALIWSGGHPQNQPAASSKHYSFASMEYSIPADLAIVPDTSTGYLSQIYVGDMGGRLWRFDINNGSAIGDLVDGGIIADFGADDAPGARRFFATPDLSLSKIDNKLMLNIAIGSGYRAHPLNRTIEDQFFVYQYPFRGYGDNYGVERTAPTDSTPGTYSPATVLDLYDTTSNIIAGGTETEITQAKAALAAAKGWRIVMESAGEKVLDRSSTFEGVVRFVSYVPAIPQGPCDPSLGNSFYYAVNLLDGTPFEDLNEGSTDPHNKDNRKKELPTPGIAPPVTTIFVENGGSITPTDVSGINTVHEWDNVELLKRWFWAENPE